MREEGLLSPSEPSLFLPSNVRSLEISGCQKWLPNHSGHWCFPCLSEKESFSFKSLFQNQSWESTSRQKKVPSKTGPPHPGTPEEFQKPQPDTEEVSLVRDQWLVSSQASLALPSEAQSDQIRETGLATEVSNDPPRKHTQIENL